jgi:hypothetical protein
MPRIDSYPNLDNTTVATDDEFVVWDTSGSQVANLPLSALDARYSPSTLVLRPIDRPTSNVYASFPVGQGLGSVTWAANANLYFVPVMLAVTRTIDRIGIEVTGAGTAATSVHRIGIWTDLNGLPETLLLDAGTVATDSTGLKEITVSPTQTLTANTLYWAGVAQQGAPATRATVRGSLASGAGMMVTNPAYSPIGYFASGITGAFASSPTISNSSNGDGVPRVFFRFT